MQAKLLTPGTAWLGLRSTLTLAQSDIEGYRVGLKLDDAGNYGVIIDYKSSTEQTVIYDGPLPNQDLVPLPEDGWVELRALSYQDKLAFFVNGQFITFVENAAKLGGTLALGVDENTTADFDELWIRDTTPHGGG